jgi:segregation and condensation protein B
MSQNNTPYFPIIQAMLFASDQPVAVENLLILLQTEWPDVTLQEVETCLQQIEASLQVGGLVLQKSEFGYRIQVAETYLDWVYRLFEQSPPKLSRALLETLAIMAHKQPVTRAEVEAVRGVSVSSQIMAQLKQFGWIKSAGVKEVPGHPTLWVTTQKLLDDLGFSSKSQLIEQLDKIVEDFMTEQKEAQSQVSIDL